MGWFVVNVLLPIFAPLVALIPFHWFPLPESAKRGLRWTTPIKDAQLAWVGVAFAAAGSYDLASSSKAGESGFGWLLGGLILFLVLNCLIAALGGVFPTETEAPAGVSAWRHFRGMTASAVTCCASGAAFAVVHFLA